MVVNPDTFISGNSQFKGSTDNALFAAVHNSFASGFANGLNAEKAAHGVNAGQDVSATRSV